MNQHIIYYKLNSLNIMDTNKRLVIALASVVFLSGIVNGEICPKFTCGTLTNNLCTTKTASDPTPAYTLQKCANENQECPFWEIDAQDQLTCIDKNIGGLKLYPGGPCSESSDCYSGVCGADKKCSGVKDGEACTDNTQCSYGHACLKNDTSKTDTYCLPQLAEGGVCTSDYDCVNTHGCYNNVCTPYYSLANGKPITDIPPKTLSFCQSGFEYNGACADLSLGAAKDVECSDTCDYTNFDGTKISIPENCLCGYNPLGKKYCKLGSANDMYRTYVTKMKTFIQNSANCNTVERPFCRQNIKFPTEAYTLLSQNVTNAQIDADNYHQLIGADSCVKDVAFPEYVPEPTPPIPPSELGGCAKYQCKDKQSTCAHSHNNSTGTTFDISVVLSDICKKNEFCWAGAEPNVAFYGKDDVDGKCTPYTPKPAPNRYPGEDCTTNTDCWQPDKEKYPDEKLVGTCVNNKCQGYNKGEDCKVTAFCTAGNYCDAGKCAAQKSKGAKCAKTEECQNQCLCFEGTCQAVWYSLGINTDVSMYQDPASYCKFGIVSKDNKCDYKNTTDTVDSKTNLVSCTVGQKCNYTSIDGAFDLDCECGYNEQGLAYCPLGTNQGKYFHIYIYIFLIYFLFNFIFRN